MRDEELAPLRASLQAYDLAARQAEESRQRIQAMAVSLRASDVPAEEELKPIHDQLAEAVRLAELASSHVRGVLGVVAAMQGLGSRPEPLPGMPYSPPPGEDYIGT